MKLAFVGDFMPSGDQSGKQIEISPKLKKRLSLFDYRIATLETALGEFQDIDSTKNARGEVAVWSKYSDVDKLKALDINVVSLANNHSCDCGINSMLKMKNELHSLGIQTIGAGKNEIEAMQPAILKKDGETVAIIGCCKDDKNALGTLHFATTNEGGIYRMNEEVLIPQIKNLKSLYTYVAIVIHWGVEHMWLPEREDVLTAKKLIEAGADMIIGGHPHHIQPIKTYKKHPIYYSLGNFHFPDFCLDKDSNTYYPNKEEFQKLPSFTWMYPNKRNFAMHYFWKYYGRLGMIAEISLSNKQVLACKRFSIYNKGYISLSLCSFFHHFIIALFSFYVGGYYSNKINNLLWRIRHVYENRVLAIFKKKYAFIKYLNKHNY